MSVRTATSLLLVLAFAIPGCTDSPVDPLSQVTDVQVTPAAATVTALGRTVAFSARAVDAGGAVIAGLRTAWTSSAPAVATVDSTGLVTAVGTGAATITARVGTVTGSAVITVTQVPATVELGQAADTLRAIGASVALAAIVRDSGTSSITGAAVAWSSSDSTVVRVDATGVATAVREGVSVITATSSGVSTSRSLVVHQIVRSVTLTPAADTARFFGQMLSYSPTARDSLDVVVDGRAVAWSSSDTTVAKVDALGRATARANGTTTISATVDGYAGAGTLLVDVRGAIRIAVDVSGGGEDADGFMVNVGDSTHRILNEPIIVTDLVPGGYAVSLGDLAAHCHGLRDRANVNVIAGDTLSIPFHVRCRGDYAYELWTGSPVDYALRFVDRHGTDVLIANNVPRTSWAWSPDGSRIAWSERVGGSADIFVANPDGTGRIRLTNHPWDDLDPSWSPDGRYIAFRSGDTALVKILVVRSDGTDSREIVQVANAATSVTGPAWSPAGDAIAYSRVSADRYSIDLWLVAPDGTNNRKLETTGRWNWKPVWSPDGSWLAYEGTDESGWALHVIRPDGTGERPVTQSGQSNLMPRWSPDGSRFLFVKYQTTYRAATIRFDGTDEEVYHEHYFWSMYPAWTADGRHVLMMAVASNLGQLAILDLDGANAQLIPGTSGGERPVARPR